MEINPRHIELKTSLGKIIIKFNSPTTMFVENSDIFVVRNVKHRFSLHLGIYENSWSMLRNEYGREERHYLNVTRTDVEDFTKRDGSDAARNKIYEVVVEKINEWAKTDEYKVVIAIVVLQKAEEAESKAVNANEVLKKQLEESEILLPKLRETVVAAKKNLNSLTYIGKTNKLFDLFTQLMPKIEKWVTPGSVNSNKHTHCAGEVSETVIKKVVNDFFDYVLIQGKDVEMIKIIEILDWLTSKAEQYRTTTTFPQDEVDAVLVVFINSIAGNHWGVDYCLYAKDLKK